MNEHTLSAQVESHGDYSVGIAGHFATVELDADEFADKEHREEVRSTLRNLYSELWDDKVNVTFSDEWTEDNLPLAW